MPINSFQPSTRDMIGDMGFGLRVDTDAISVAAASTKDIFNVEGGNCIILALIGESTTGQAAGANAVTWISTPDTGTAVNLSGGVTSIASHEAGGIVSLTGVFATATLVTNAGASELPYNPFLVAPGVIGFATAGNTAGSYKFSVWYVPAEPGAYIEAAF